MPEPQKTVYVDGEVSSQVLSVISEAQKYVVVVTPYIDLWQHAENAIALSVSKGIDVTFVVRDEPNIVGSESIAWLLQNKVKVHAAPRLHAKIYLNEASVLVSSMNLLKSSAQNSLEIALAIRDKEVAESIRGYVRNTLMRLAASVKGMK